LPIYEYECRDCKEQFEELRRITDKSQIICVNCKSTNVQKLVSACSFELKGTGWYKTDYKDKKPEKKNETPVKKTPK